MTPTAVFEDLFSQARRADEFEYATALLRVRGMEDIGWDPLEETDRLFSDIGSLLEAPLRLHPQIRLGLLLYSHLTEVDAIYRVLANMIEISAGERYTIDPFDDLYQRRGRIDRRPPSANTVVRRVRERAARRGLSDLVDLLDWFFNDQVRNAFFHSDYILFETEFRSREAIFVVDGIRTNAMPLESIADLIQRGIDFYQGFRDTYLRHRGSYREEKLIQGRIAGDGSYTDVLLLATEQRGLYGFRSPEPAQGP